jgi:WD40 repeat protein
MGLAGAQRVAYSPDGALLAVAGPRFRLLDTRTWQEVRSLENTQFRTATMERLAFAASGTLLLGMRDDQLGFWRVDDGAFLYSLDLATPLHRMSWRQQVAPSNTPLLALTDGKTAALWDVDRRAVTRWISPTQGEIAALTLSEKADRLALVEGEAQAADASFAFTTSRISLWDTGRERLLQTIPILDATVSALALSPDAQTLAVVEAVVEQGSETACDTWVRFYGVADGQLLRHTAAWRASQGCASMGVGYVPGGDLVAVATAAGQWLVRASDAAVVNVIPDLSGNLAFSPDGKSASAGNSIEIRKISDGTIVDLIPASTGNQAPTFSPDGRFLASADGNDLVLWRMAEGTISTRFTGLGKNVQALAFSPDGRTLASGGKDAVVRILGMERSAEPVVVQQRHPVTSVAFSPDGSILATADSNGNIYIRDPKTGASANVWYGQGAVRTLAFSPDGRWLVSGGTGPALRLWEVQTGRTLASAAHGAGVVALAFSPDGSRLASSASKRSCGPPCPQDEGDPEIMIWRVTDTALLVESTIPTFPQDPEGTVPTVTHAAVWGLAFAPDGKTLLTAGPQNAGHIYQVPEGTLLASFGSFFAETPFAVSPDATRIVIGASPIEIWCAAGK